MHGHAAVVGVVDRGVPDVLPFGIADQMPVDRIPGKRQVLAHAIELDALDKHLARAHRHHVPAVERLFRRVGRCLETDIARQQTDFATFIHVEGDLAEVHVVQLLVERDRISPDGGNGAPLGLPGIEIRGREDNLVADPPARRRPGPVSRCCLRRPCLASLVQVFFRSPCRFRVPPMSMIPRSLRSFAPPMPPMSSSLTLLVRVMVALRVWGLASVPISSSPCNRIHSVVSSRSALFAKLSLPSIVRLPSAGGLTSRSTFLSRCNGDLVASGWHLPVRPGGRIRPARLPDCRRSGILSLNDSEHAAEQECWKERSKKERAMSLTHGINLPVLEDDQEPQRQSIAR